MNRRIVVLAVAAAALLSGCATTIIGKPQPAGTEAGYGQGPGIPEAPADWAISALEPCALLQGTPLPATAPPFASKPHNCAVDFAKPDGKTDRLVVRVGMSFDTGDRVRSAPTTVGGLVAFQSHDVKGDKYDPPDCILDIPISATRSIQVDSTAVDGDVTTACAGTRAAAEPIAAKLASPAALARTTPPTGLPSWHACDLLETALGYKAERGALGSSNADECVAGESQSGSRFDGAEIGIGTDSGSDEPLVPSSSETAITLPLGPSIQAPYGKTMCKIVTVVARTPGAPKNTATHVMTITARRSPDLCAAAVAAATKIHQVIQSTPAKIPAAPAKLGFTPNEPSDVVPVPCGRYGNTRTPDMCREPRPVEVPKGAAAVLKAGSFGKDAPDVNCAILREAGKPVVGDMILAAQGEASCLAVTDDVEVTFGLFNEASPQQYCNLAELKRADVEVGGRAGIVCSPGETVYQLVLPAVGATRADVGVMNVQVTLMAKRGDRTIDEPRNADRVRELTTKIAEAAIKQYFT